MNDLKDRTKEFALDVVRHCAGYSRAAEYQIITRQLLRSSTSVAANYRAACRGKSKADFINKLSVVEEEADESLFWMEMLAELSGEKNAELTRLMDEASQIVAIMVSSKKTARRPDGR